MSLRGVGHLKQIGYEETEQPNLSPALLDKIADTFYRKTGRTYTPLHAQAWWDWVWPVFESYWKQKRYRSVSRAILSWASRVHERDIIEAIRVTSVAENIALETQQSEMNERPRAVGQVVQIDYFSKLRGAK